MYEIAVEHHFDAAHSLRGYHGKCEAVHGHRFRVVVKVKASVLDDIGLAYDFTELKRRLGDILTRFDHTFINEVPPFDEINPSSENIARTIYHEIEPKFAGTPVSLSAVEVGESPQSWVTYRTD